MGFDQHNEKCVPNPGIIITLYVVSILSNSWPGVRYKVAQKKRAFHALEKHYACRPSKSGFGTGMCTTCHPVSSVGLPPVPDKFSNFWMIALLCHTSSRAPPKHTVLRNEHAPSRITPDMQAVVIFAAAVV